MGFIALDEINVIALEEKSTSSDLIEKWFDLLFLGKQLLKRLSNHNNIDIKIAYSMDLFV